MQRFLILFILGGLLISCAKKGQMPITEMSSVDLENAVLLDVRTPDEFAEGHLEGAVNMDWYQENFIDQLTGFKKLPHASPTGLYIPCNPFQMIGRPMDITQRCKKRSLRIFQSLNNFYNTMD